MLRWTKGQHSENQLLFRQQSETCVWRPEDLMLTALSHSHIHKGFIFNSSGASGDIRDTQRKGMQTREQISKVLPLTEGPPPVTVFVEGHLVDPRGKSAQCSGRPGPRVPREGGGPFRTQSPISSQEEEQSVSSTRISSCVLSFHISWRRWWAWRACVKTRRGWKIVVISTKLWPSLVAQMVKNLPAMQEIQVWSLGWGDPWRREWQPTPVSLPREFHGQRSLAGYSLWSHKESDTLEQLIHSLFLLDCTNLGTRLKVWTSNTYTKAIHDSHKQRCQRCRVLFIHQILSSQYVGITVCIDSFDLMSKGRKRLHPCKII